MISQALLTSNSDEWYTPSEVYNKLNSEFHFNLDPCATVESAKCEKYFTKEENGLSKNWGGHRVFCNPPYSEIAKWVEKAYRETREDNTLVVMLIPARTDTRYFHDFIYNRSEIRFIKGRLNFSQSKNSSPFPSMIVIFRGAKLEPATEGDLTEWIYDETHAWYECKKCGNAELWEANFCPNCGRKVIGKVEKKEG